MCNKDDIPAVVLGTCIGDALGAPFENKDPDSDLVKEWDGLFQDTDTFHNLKAGQYTDDGGMTVALAKSLLRSKGFNPENVAKHYLDWSKGSYFRGAGRNTREALANLEKGIVWSESGKTEAMTKHIYGSGPSMRVAPIGLYYRNDIDALISAAEKDAIITHNSAEPQIGAIAVALGIAFLATGECTHVSLIDTVIKYLPNCMVKQNLQLAQRLIDTDQYAPTALYYLGNDKPTAYLIQTNVATAFYCVATATSFHSAVYRAVSGGWDADTNAAVAGALYGAYCGTSKIPDKLKYGVENHSMLMKLDELLYNSA